MRSQASFWFDPWINDKAFHDLFPDIYFNDAEVKKDTKIYELWFDGRWQLPVPISSDVLQVWEVVKKVCVSDNVEDSICWLAFPSVQTDRPDKLTHIHFYLHEQVLGANATDAVVATGGNNSVNPAVSFRVGNRLRLAQGFLAVSSQTEISVKMTMNFIFTNGKFNGSTLSILGQNNLSLKVRELSIVGGTGIFRFARGY
ncbi:dirigent protein 8-like, partial [Rutidosis leptorrhynchoides]|uniref:dirigent protein 8-like n=1 Tax=Rutidosis leptorrhynchoides TaxID=125765 RepID=UPI003A99387F